MTPDRRREGSPLEYERRTGERRFPWRRVVQVLLILLAVALLGVGICAVVVIRGLNSGMH